ncbi:branched-chain amino acid ABC transporter permease [Bacillota bacterium Meth-B3]|nr:branched-chain amino acid ABC transporter permease [Christensenellaceae bacterium]
MKKPIKWVLSLAAIALLAWGLMVLEEKKFEQAMLYSVLQKGAIFAIAATAMNLLNGFTGLFSLGQAGFMAVGAYTTAILLIPTGKLDGVYYMNGIAPALKSMREFMDLAPGWLGACYPYLALVAGGLVAALFAALIGIPVLRLKSDYLAIATLGFSEIIRALIASPQFDTLTNGSYGLKSIPKFDSIGVIFLIAFLCIGMIVLLIRSSYGRAFKAIREDEIAAEAMGICLFRHKEMSFVVSSFFTAVAGGMLAMYMRSIDSSTFKVAMTYDILLIVVIGGIGSVTGSVVGAFLVTAAKEWWLRFFDEPLALGGVEIPLFKTGFRMVVFSLLLMVVVLFYRRGLMGTNEFSWDWLTPGHWRNRKVPTGGVKR